MFVRLSGPPSVLLSYLLWCPFWRVTTRVSQCPSLYGPLEELTRGERGEGEQGSQMAKFDPFLSLDCGGVEGVGAQSKEGKGSNFAA